MPDYFDRLIGRSLGAEAGDQPWVRPRLPQLFERPALELHETRIAATAPDPAAAPPPPPPRQPTGEHVVEHTRTTETVRARAVPDPPPLSPTSPLSAPAPTGRTPDPVVPSAAPITTVDVLPVTPPAAPVAGPVLDRPLAARPVPPAPADPRPAAPVAARSATPAGRADRPQPAPERVVRISIGRLAVTAAGSDRPARDAERRERSAPRVSLDRYLGREETTT